MTPKYLHRSGSIVVWKLGNLRLLARARMGLELSRHAGGCTRLCVHHCCEGAVVPPDVMCAS